MDLIKIFQPMKAVFTEPVLHYPSIVIDMLEQPLSVLCAAWVYVAKLKIRLPSRIVSRETIVQFSLIAWAILMAEMSMQQLNRSVKNKHNV